MVRLKKIKTNTKFFQEIPPKEESAKKIQEQIMVQMKAWTEHKRNLLKLKVQNDEIKTRIKEERQLVVVLEEKMNELMLKYSEVK